MVIQKVVLQEKICGNQALLMHCNRDTDSTSEGLLLEPQDWISTDSYMNIFDAFAWEKYTSLNAFICRIEAEGQYEAQIYRKSNQADATQDELIKTIAGDNISSVVSFWITEAGMYYVRLTAITKTIIRSITFETDKAPANCKIGLIICTYNRQKELIHNLELIKNSRFNRENDELFGRLECLVVDNASTISLDSMTNYPGLKLVHNINSGGAGGFAKGIELVRQDEDITHVIFMDDDVLFDMESLYRLYALACYASDSAIPVAGRMFRLDNRAVQYTACEIWNAGDIKHIGYNVNMCDEIDFEQLNANAGGEYAGWWLAMYSADYVRDNTPIPVFLHCDDVEYGLRAGRTPFILNGIHVWHETYEYRQNAIIEYYDTRNPLFVNLKYNLMDAQYELDKWKNKITMAHISKDFYKEYMIICGMRDFLKGEKWLYRISPEKNHQAIIKNRKLVKWRNKFLWRICARRFKNRFL